MARTATLQAIRNLARLYADQRPGGDTDQLVVDTPTSTAAGVNTLINNACAKYYEILVQAAGPERFMTSEAISIVAGTSLYAVHANHLRTHGVVLEWGTQRWEQVHQYDDPMERVAYENAGNWQENARKAYRLEGTNLRFAPTPTSAVTCRHYYTPNWVNFTHDTSDTKDFVNGWERLPALEVAIELLAIEQEANPRLEKMLEREIARIEGMASERDEQPLRILDVSRRVYVPYAESPDV